MIYITSNLVAIIYGPPPPKKLKLSFHFEKLIKKVMINEDLSQSVNSESTIHVQNYNPFVI